MKWWRLESGGGNGGRSQEATFYGFFSLDIKRHIKF